MANSARTSECGLVWFQMTCSDYPFPLPRFKLSEASAQRSPRLSDRPEARRLDLSAWDHDGQSRAFGCRRWLERTAGRGLCSADRSSLSLHPTSSSHGPLQPRQHTLRRLRSAERQAEQLHTELSLNATALSGRLQCFVRPGCLNEPCPASMA